MLALLCEGSARHDIFNVSLASGFVTLLMPSIVGNIDAMLHLKWCRCMYDLSGALSLATLLQLLNRE